MQIIEHPETRAVTASAGFAADAARGKRRFLPQNEIAQCQTFRDACAMAWKNRAVDALTLQMLAAHAGLYPSHVSDYFQAEPINPKGNPRRSLPADKVADVERVLGNHVLSQYLMHRGMLTIMEAVIAERTA